MNPGLAELAARHGVATEYWDQDGAHHSVGEATVVAVLAALGVAADSDEEIAVALADADLADWRRPLPPVFMHRRSRVGRIWVHVPHGTPVVAHLVWEDGSGAQEALQLDHWVEPRLVDGVLTGEAAFEIPAGLPTGYHQFQARTPDGAVHVCPLVVTPDRLPDVAPGWGLLVQLYSARSRASWGIGDLGDLALLADAVAAADGAFVLVNPIHAASPVDPMEPSPYLPVTRRFANPVYLDMTPVIDAAAAASDPETRAVVTWLQERARALSREDVIDWAEAWRLKKDALTALWPAGITDVERFQAYVNAQGVALQDFSLWCALAEDHGPRWQEWPADLRDVRSPAVTAAFAEKEDRVLFYSWLQFLMAEQLSAAQDTAVAAGMGIGVIHDLAVGVHADGADTWRLGPLLAPDVSVGAPPDMYNRLGQNWAQPPWRPGALADAAFTPYRDMLRAVLQHAGGVRVDHILGLYRQWWIPDGFPPAEGTYVAMDHEALVGILVLEASRVGAVVIGEDLGTVADWIRSDMADRGILGTGVLWFEHEDSRPRAPEHWRATALASVTVHDLPPTAGYLAGEHVRLREELGLLADAEGVRAAQDREVAAWRDLLVARGWLDGAADDAGAVVTALHRCLAASPAVLLGVSLPDLTGDVRIQNQPGTHREYPNWCQPLSDAAGGPVWVEEIGDQPLWADITAAVRRG